MGQVAAPGLGGATQRGGELDHRELRHLRTALPTQRQAGLVPAVGRPNQRRTGVHRRPPRRGPHHPSSGVVLGRLCTRAQPPTRRRGRRTPERVRVQGRGHRGTNSTTEHRQSRGVGSPLWTRDSGPVGVDRKVASSAGCGGFETVAARPPQPPGAAATCRRTQASFASRSQRRLRRSRQARPAVGERVPTLRRFRDGRSATSSTSGGPVPAQPRPDRSQPSDGNPIASPPLALAGAVNPPREPQRKHPGLTAPVVRSGQPLTPASAAVTLGADLGSAATTGG